MTTRRFPASALLMTVALTAPFASRAASPQEMYAKLCSDPVAATTKGCVEFARELGITPATAPAAAAATAAASAPAADASRGDADATAELKRQWGALGEAAGHVFESDAYVVLVWWDTPGQQIAVDWYERGASRVTLTYRFTRNAQTGAVDGDRVSYQVLSDGTLWTEQGRNHAWVLTPDRQFVLAKGSVTNGVFTRSGEFLAPAKQLSGEQASAQWARLRPAQAARMQASATAAPAVSVAADPPTPTPTTPTRVAAATAPAVALPGSSTTAPPAAVAHAPAAAPSPPPPSVPAAAAATGEVPELWKQRFGPFATLGGRTTVAAVMGKQVLTNYDWVTPGEKMEIVGFLPTGGVIKSTLTWDEANARVQLAVEGTTSASGGTYMSLQQDGSMVSVTPAYPQYRSITRRLSDGSLESVSEENKGGTWVPMTAANIARVHDGPRPRGQTVAAAPRYDLPPVTGYDVATWGPIARFVGTSWSDAVDGKQAMLARSVRVEPLDGTSAVRMTVSAGLMVDEYVMRPGSEPGTLVGAYTSTIGGSKTAQVTGITFLRESDDVLRSKPYTSNGVTFQYLMARGSRGDLWFEQALSTDGKAPQFINEKRILAAEDPNAVDTTAGTRFQQVSRQQALAQDRAGAAEHQRMTDDSIRQYQAEQEAKRPRSGGGGALLGKLFVMSAGAAAAVAGGGSTEQIIGGALKGAQIAGVDGVGGAADTLLTSGGSSSAASAAGGASGGASFPTKPNLATGACPGFTESNYRTKALEGGPDTQLKTMCGQAFEYYAMYERAISQGYSEADCNRTYAAHEQSARVAISYGNGG